MAENTSGFPRNTPGDRTLRASDRDRDAVGEILRHHHALGRLDTDEFTERYGRSLEAKTYAQLDELISDLPAGPDAAGSASAGRAPGPWGAVAHRWAGLRWRMPVFAWVLLALAAVAVAHGLLWVIVPITFFWVGRTLMWRRACGPWHP